MSKLNLLEAIDNLLPQTQCERCGYPGCQPYADAIVNANEDINKCTPGGDVTAQEISKLTGKEFKTVTNPILIKEVALIDETTCIGCKICIRECPVDAIIGANKTMHTVITDYCTGCELCIAPCPVGCISMQATAEVPDIIDKPDAQAKAKLAKDRFDKRKLRLNSDKQQKLAQHAKPSSKTASNKDVSIDILAAVQRSKSKHKFSGYGQKKDT